MTEPDTSGSGTSGRRPTIMEVARLAGVSHQTVSRYIRFNSGVKPATRAKLDAAIKELNYRPNLVARSMRTRRTGRLAVLVPAIAFNPARMLDGASSTAFEAGYSVDVLSLAGGAEARAERIAELADSGQFEGILSFAPLAQSSEGHFADSPPIVVSADFDDEMRSIGELADGGPVTEIMERLVQLGHRRFFHVAGDEQFASARARKQTYLETIDRLQLESVGVFDGDWSGESGLAALRSLDERNLPTAILAANDLVAAGVLRGARDRGWDVPADISLTGWDNDRITGFLSPSLTTVDVDLERVGSKAMARLISSISDEPVTSSTAPMTRIIWRESVGNPPIG